MKHSTDANALQNKKIMNGFVGGKVEQSVIGQLTSRWRIGEGIIGRETINESTKKK